jgi:hypothetical protein
MSTQVSKKKQRKIDLNKRRIAELESEIEMLEFRKASLENELFYLEHPECKITPHSSETIRYNT